MHYRVVLQGRGGGDADVATVKREFARVTGLPRDVTERLFAQVPHPLKEGLRQADAERIAATLRAIGAAVTVERDLLASLDAGPGGAQEILPPNDLGPPTVVPGAAATAAPAPAPGRPAWVRRLRRRALPVAAVVVTLAAIVAGLPYLEDLLHRVRPVRAAAAEQPKVAAAPVDAAPATVPRDPASLLGPWRCTDQRTGLPEYWTYGADGRLTYHGDTFKEGVPPPTGPAVPDRWQLADDRLVHVAPGKGPVTYVLSDLTLTRLRYGDGRNLDIQCRRP